MAEIQIRNNGQRSMGMYDKRRGMYRESTACRSYHPISHGWREVRPTKLQSIMRTLQSNKREGQQSGGTTVQKRIFLVILDGIDWLPLFLPAALLLAVLIRVSNGFTVVF